MLRVRLMAEGQCTQCPIQRVGGDGSAIDRPRGRIHTPGFLRGMVEQCNTRLNLGFFPGEVTAVAAVLNRDHDKFKPRSDRPQSGFVRIHGLVRCNFAFSLSVKNKISAHSNIRT